MTCTPFKSADGKVTGIVCTRGRRRRTCQVVDRTKGKLCRAPAELLCDGCDLVVCSSCSVQVQHSGAQRDFCPHCFEPVFRSWLKAAALGSVPTERAARRAAFREWAKRNPEFFAQLQLSTAGAA